MILLVLDTGSIMRNLNIEPYTMTIKDAAPYFGYSAQGLYDLIYKGELIFGTHFLKAGKKILIIVTQFKIFLHDKSGVSYGDN